MDFISHGLWGGITLGRSNRRSYALAFVFGMAPDLCSFGLVFVNGLLTHGLDFFNGLGHPPEAAQIPVYVHTLYNATHSLPVFAAAFLLVWLLRRRPLWEMGAWGLHIALDIGTHSAAFFPTPLLWPLSDVHVDGVPWSEPRIFFTNLVLLLMVHAWFLIRRRRKAG